MSKAKRIATSKQVVVFSFIDSLRIFEDKCFAADIVFAKAKESVLGSHSSHIIADAEPISIGHDLAGTCRRLLVSSPRPKPSKRSQDLLLLFDRENTSAENLHGKLLFFENLD